MAPLSETSWTMPDRRCLISDLTKSTILPLRWVTMGSCRTSCRCSRLRVRSREAVSLSWAVRDSSRISFSLGVALSRTSPDLPMAEETRVSTSSRTGRSLANTARAGMFFWRITTVLALRPAFRVLDTPRSSSPVKVPPKAAR